MGAAVTDGAADCDRAGARSARPRLELVGIATDPGAGAVQALTGAHLTAEAGEIVGLCGDNGPGKSALVAILAGGGPPRGHRGHVLVDGVERRLATPTDAQRAGIAVVYAHSLLVPQLSVAHNLMLGQEPRWFGLVDEVRLQSRAQALLERYGFAGDIDPAAPVSALPLGLQQIVEIIRAISRDARVLVLDEPAARLSATERSRLVAWLRTLGKDGLTCVYVAHRVDELMGVCDHITILRDGRTAQTVCGSPGARHLGGRYQVHDEIAAGGMATVHLGTMRGPFGFSSTVAIKRLHAALAKDPEFVAMFLDEARLASRVRHPNVVPVLDVFAEDGDLSLVMEYVDGESLATLLRLAARDAVLVPVPVATAITASILHGLHAAHEARDERGALLGLVHRDVSPQNVLVGADGVVRLIDFGIAKAAGRRSASRNGQLKGKVAYMAPEQIQRGNVSRCTDVYGAAVLLWELLAGERLFDGETEGMVIGRVLDDEVPPPSSLRADLPAGLDAVVLRGLDRRADRRFASARDMARALERTAPIAPADEVAAWVDALAGARITDRRAILARLERAALAEEALQRAAEDSSRPAPVAPPASAEGGALARAASALLELVRRRPSGKPAPDPASRA